MDANVQYRDVDKALKTYWKKQGIFHDSSIADKHCFVNPTEEIPVETSRFLKHLDLELVGAYYRNRHVQRYNRRLKHCRRRYRNERNTNESFNNYLKQHMGFETSLPRKGREHAFKHTTLCLIAVNAVALTRLQNGETEHLTSVAYLT